MHTHVELFCLSGKLTLLSVCNVFISVIFLGLKSTVSDMLINTLHLSFELSKLAKLLIILIIHLQEFFSLHKQSYLKISTA